VVIAPFIAQISYQLPPFKLSGFAYPHIFPESGPLFIHQPYNGRLINRAICNGIKKEVFMTYALRYGLRPADRIVECITQLGISKHHCVYLGADYQGTEWIAENYKFKAVRLIKAADYFETILRIERIQRFQGSPKQRREAVQRALDLVDQPYSLINFNCEHFAEYVQYGKSKSSQVENVFAGLFALLIVGIIVSE
jgi:hypothetical protein